MGAFDMRGLFFTSCIQFLLDDTRAVYDEPKFGI
jgi:hypothetical protein